MSDKSYKNIFFLYNPVAGKAKIKSYLHEVVDVFVRAGHRVTIHPTQQKGDAKQIVDTLPCEEYDLVVCCGGDGTLDEVVTGMVTRQDRLPVGYIPAGSTNDFANSLGISHNMVVAAHEIVNGKEFACDVGRFNEDAFVYVAAFGLFTEVSYTTDQQMKNLLGHAAYVLEGVKSLSSIKSYRIRFENDERVIEDEFIYGMITNSTSVGGIKSITGRNVELDDGKFEVTLIKKPANLMELNNIVISLATQRTDSPYIYAFKTSHLQVYSSEPMNWTLDGEFAGTHQRVDIENEHRVLSIMVSRYS